jgi:hypothetical protein
MESLTEKVTNRIAEADRSATGQSASINRAIALSDRFIKVTPQEYILPLNLFSQVPNHFAQRTPERGE